MKAKKKPLRINQSARETLMNALEAADMNNASCAVAPEHKEAMKLYLNTWVVARIKYALQIIDNERSGRTPAI